MPMISPASPDNESIKKTSENLERLTKATIEFNQQTSKQTDKIIWLTWLMLAGLAVQILMAGHVSKTCEVSQTEGIYGEKKCITRFDLGMMGQFQANF